MSSRFASAILALIAAGSIALSLLVLPWWAGHPSVGGGEAQRVKTVHIGLLAAEGCDNRGCQPLPLGTGFATTRYIELATGGVLVLSTVLLAILALAGSERRQVVAKIVISAAGASIIVALALLLLGPDIVAKQTISVPKDLIGMLAFWVGTGFSILAGVLALRPTPRVVLRPPRAAAAAAPVRAPAPPAPIAPPVDVLALFHDDPPATAPAASNQLPGPSGPLGMQLDGGQLRPLYDAAPNHGGTNGFVPGIATPPPFSPPIPTPAPGSIAPLGNRPKTLPPPMRSKPPSMAPPIPPPQRNSPPPSRPPITRAQATFAAAVVPPPTPPPHTPTPRQTILPQMQSSPEDELETMDRDQHAADSLDNTFDAAATSALPEHVAQDYSEQTDIGAILSVGDSTSPSVSFEGATSESPRFERPNTDDDQLANAAREKQQTTDMDLPTVAEPSSAAASIAAAVLAPASPATSSRISISPPGPVSLKTPPAPAAKFPPVRTPAPKPHTPHPIVPAMIAPIMAPVIVPMVIPNIPSIAAPIPEPVVAPVEAPAAPPSTPNIPMSTAPDSLPPPSEKQVKSSGPSPACPQCESPMAWVEAHLRFYCKSCRMYF